MSFKKGLALTCISHIDAIKLFDTSAVRSVRERSNEQTHN